MKNVEKTVEIFKKEFNLRGTLTARKLKSVIKKMNCELFTYEGNEGLLEKLKLSERAKYNPSVSCSVGDRNYIFYRGTISDRDLPFVLSHEIGHAYMNHLNRSNGYDDTSDRKDAEANVFATRLLYPQKQKKSKVSLVLTLTTLLLSLFAVGVVSTDIIDILQLPVETQPASEPTLVVAEQAEQTPEDSPKESEFIDRLIIQVENATASPKTDAPTQSTQLPAEQPEPQPAKEPEIPNDILNITEQVIVTRTGRKYHKPTCSYLKNKTGTTTYTITEAEANYYAPCSRCFK